MTNKEKEAFFAMLNKYKMNPTIIPASPIVPRDRIVESKASSTQAISREKDGED